MRRYALATLILLTVVSALFGALSATYTPAEFISFKLGNEISGPATPLGTFTTDDLVARIGTIVITATGGSHLVHPRLVNYNSGSIFLVRGKVSGWNNDISILEFHLWAKTSFRTDPFELWLGDEESPLHSWTKTTITQNPFIADLYLVNHHEISLFIPGETYTLVSGSLGSFNIISITTPDGWEPVYIPVNNQTLPPGGGPPTNPIPIPVGGAGVPIPDIPFGDDPLPVQLTYGLTIITESPFLTSSAYTPNSAKVATAQLFISGGQQNTTYKVDITFRNAANSPSFNLRLGGDPDGYAIAYALLFGNEEMTGGTATRWTPLSNGENLRDISVRILSPTTAQAAPSGSFQDVIYVEVTPVE
jgi:hypothetical protein